MSTSLSSSSRYNAIVKLLEDTDLSVKLLLISNLLFECYPEAKIADLIYNKLDKPDIEVLEDYSYMKELYNFHDTSFVYVILDRAHDILRLSLELDKVKYGQNNDNPK